MARVTRFPGPNRSKADGISGQLSATREIRRGVVYGIHVRDPVSLTAFLVELSPTERNKLIASWKEQDARATVSARGTPFRGGLPAQK